MLINIILLKITMLHPIFDLQTQIDSVEGIDYLNDYYGILQIPQTATQEEIKKALTNRRAEWHTDRRLPKKTKQDAPEMVGLFQLAEDILLEPQLKEIYDAKYDSFEIKRTNHVVPQVITEPDQKKVSLEHLLSGKQLDTAKISDWAKKESGYNEDTLQSMKNAHETTKDSSVKQLYVEELNKKFQYLLSLEDIAWVQAGLLGRKSNLQDKIQSPIQYLQHLEVEAINIIIQDIPTGIEQRLLAYDQGSQLLIAGPINESSTLSPDEIKQEVSTNVREQVSARFLEGFEGVKEIAKQRQEVTEELLDFTQFEYLQQTSQEDLTYDVFLIGKNGSIMSNYKFDLENGTSIPTTNYAGQNLNVARELDFKNNSILIHHNPNFGGNNLMEPLHVLNNLID